MKERVLTLFKTPFRYDSFGQMIFDANNELVANIRNWGRLQYEKEGDKYKMNLVI